jgi:uncharacterized protein YbjT (DUF2867 family)
MKILIAGAFGNFGREILRAAVTAGHKVTAADKVVRPVDFGGFTTRIIDVQDRQGLKGIAKGMDIVISNVGLTTSHKSLSHEDIDYEGNRNLLAEARMAGVKRFIYISLFKADEAKKNNPLLYARHRFENELIQSAVPYLIYRPTGYFHDLANMFRPMVEKGTGTLLFNARTRINVVDTREFATYIIANLKTGQGVVDIGGMQTYSYKDIGRMFFQAADIKVHFKRIPALFMSLEAWYARLRRTGRHASLAYTRWALTHDLVSKHIVGNRPLEEYIKSLYP